MSSTSKRKKILKDTIFINSATIFEKIIFFVINVAITRYLTIQEFGEYATALGYATFFSIFSTIGINQSLIRSVNLDCKNENYHFGNVITIKTILAVTVYIILIASSFTTNYSINTIYLIFILGLVRIGNEYMQTFFALHNARENFLFITKITFYFGILFLSVTFLVIYLKGNYFHIAFSRLAVIIFIIAYMAISTLKTFKIKLNFKLLPNFIKTTIPFGLSTICGNIIQRSNIIILTLIHGTTLGGVFNNGYIIVVSLMFISSNFDKVLLPHLYKISFKHNKQQYQYIFEVFTKFLLILSGYISLLLVLFSHEIIPLIFGNKYVPSINVLKIAALSLPFQFNIYGSIIRSLDREPVVTKITFIAVIVNVVSCFSLGYFFQAEGIACAMALTYLANYSAQIFYLKFYRQFSIGIFLKIVPPFIIIAGVSYFLVNYIITDLHFLIQMIIFSILYCLLAITMIVKKEEVKKFKSLIIK